MRICACICVHDDSEHLSATIRSLPGIPILVFVSRLDWNGGSGNWRGAVAIAEEAAATVIEGDWPEEGTHRKSAYEIAASRGFTHALIVDSDEIVEPKLLDNLLKIADADLADRVYVEWNTYWKTPEYVIRPRERFTPCYMINLSTARHTLVREFEGGRHLFLSEEYGIVQHLSYVGSDERIWKKITTWGHKHEVVQGWWERVWKSWDATREMRGLHPTNPQAYGFAERIPTPEILSNLGYQQSERTEISHGLKSWPQLSVVIPAHQGQDDLDACLQSLEKCKDLLHEVIVVDDGSPQPLTVTGSAYCIRLEKNSGFAHACNQGFNSSSGEVVVFLNSDTLVPRAGLVRLIESLESSRTCAAAGPLTNNASHLQQISVSYTRRENVNLFAQDFAEREASDREVDMLVGFCLAIRREAFEEVGGFDERFGIGTFEDNDLSYRLRRAGYKLMISARSYIHHEGSKTLRRVSQPENGGLDIISLLKENQAKYQEKWREDIETGFASHLSGMSPAPIEFKPELKPEKRLASIASISKRANISLCMIVRDEERVIEDCLQSARPFFKEMLILDTGSKDRTVELAEGCGALVTKTEWPDSFGTARTQSMKGATGDWIMWLDADDTLPISSGEAIVRAVASAPRDIVGFVVPVRFLENTGGGTQVDHVKVFRNFSGLEWEGRIHEQILPALRRAATQHNIPGGGRIARLDAYVLHSGYDTSEEGQAKKRERDEYLLKLDLEERPGHPFVLFNLGMTAHYTSRQEEAEKWLRECIKASGDNESHLRKAYALLGASLRLLGKKEDANDALIEGNERVGGDPEIQFYLAQLHAERGDHEKAIALYRSVLEADVSGYFTSIDPGILGYKARHNLALSFMAIGDYESAKGEWLSAIENSGRVELTFPLFEQAIKHSDAKTVKDLLAFIQRQTGYSEIWANMVLKSCEMIGIPPMPILESALAFNPNNHGVRLVLARYLLKTGHCSEAAEQFLMLQASGVAEAAYALGLISLDSGQKDKAIAWLQRAHTLNPSHTETLDRLNSLIGLKE